MKINFMKVKKTFQLFTMILFFLCSTAIYSQNLRLDLKNVSLKEAMEKITEQTGYRFFYENSLESVLKSKVSIKSENEQLEKVLTRLFSVVKISYKIAGKSIALNIEKKTGTKKAENADSKVSGRIIDSKGLPVIGAVISVKGGNEYVVAGNDGSYSINASEEDVLVANSVGYKTAEFPVVGRSVVDMTLEEDVQMLDDVVVTGYQTISRERATGSFVKVTSEDMKVKPVSSIAKALEGMVPGMESNGSNRFVIRGVGTMQSQKDIDPLVVVDGFAVQGFSNGTNPFDMVNPNDVESVTVLKDAAATSIYGARAANGVIVITTKSAKNKDKININFDARVTVLSKYDLEYYMDFADGQTQLDYMMQMEKYSTLFDFNPYSNAKNPKTFVPELTQLIYEYKRAGNLSESEFNTAVSKLMSNEGKWVDDYNKYFFRNAIQQQYNLGINGSSRKNKYMFSLMYNNNLGSSIGNSDNRVLLNFNDTYKFIDKLSLNVGVTANYRSSVNNGVSVGSLKEYTTPFTRLFNEDGSYAHIPINGTVYAPILFDKYEDVTEYSWTYNPLQDRDQYNSTSSSMSLRFQSSLEYEMFKSLRISLRGQYETAVATSQSEVFDGAFAIRDLKNTYSKLDAATGKYKTFFPEGGSISKSGNQYQAYNLRAQIDFNKTIKEDHNITAMVIAEASSSTRNIFPYYSAYGYNRYTNAVLTSPDYVSKVTNIFGVKVRYPYPSLGSLDNREDRFVSAGANFAYSYKNKYVFSASARSDASNFLADDVKKKFSPFWSVGFVWNLSKEKFVSAQDWIDDLRMRVSYGTAGVAAGKNSMSTITTIKTFSGSVAFTNNEPYNAINLPGNPTLTWEKSRTLNTGVDFSFFKGQLYGSLEYYNRYSYDVLAEATVPYASQSTPTITYNNAAISNSGVELSLGSRLPVYKKDIVWKGDLNFSYNKSVVKKYNVTPAYPGGRYVVGLPMSPVWGYKLVGHTELGVLKMEGKDGSVIEILDKESSHLDDILEAGQGPNDNNWKRYYGTSTPPVNIGFTNTFEFYGFTLSFMITGKFGHLFTYDNYNTNIYPKSTDLALRSFAKDALEMDRSGYSKGLHTFPVLNEANTDIFNAGSLYDYSSRVFSSADWHIRDASHIRLNSVYFGYELPDRLFEKVMLKNVNIYFEAGNLGTIWVANDLGYDPEAMPGELKPLKTYLFGVRLNF